MVTTMFEVEVLEVVAVIETSVAEFSVTVVCDVDNVIDGPAASSNKRPGKRPHPVRREVKQLNKNNLIIIISYL